ncbi:MAG: right-handed parallel beta-helix repeat-containing protein [Planctomycetia bacterium]|nr:right-handed parallel beta-helix repeat-containing protein [Planctomycetia bacterium]
MSESNPKFTNCSIHHNHSLIHIREAQGTFENCSIFIGNDIGVCIETNSRSFFRNCKISNVSMIGMGIAFCGGVTVEKCDFLENGTGISMISASGEIRDSKIQGSGVEIGLINDSTAHIMNTEISKNGRGLVVFQSMVFAEGCQIFNHREHGIVIEKKGNGEISNCEIHENHEAGILVKKGCSLDILTSKIHNEKTGVIYETDTKGNLTDVTMENNKTDCLIMSEKVKMSEKAE